CGKGRGLEPVRPHELQSVGLEAGSGLAAPSEAAAHVLPRRQAVRSRFFCTLPPARAGGSPFVDGPALTWAACGSTAAVGGSPFVDGGASFAAGWRLASSG